MFGRARFERPRPAPMAPFQGPVAYARNPLPGVYIPSGTGLQLSYFASQAPTKLFGTVDVIYDDGKRQTFVLQDPGSFTTDRTFQAVSFQGTVTSDGTIVAATIGGDMSGVRRGGFYGFLQALTPGHPQGKVVAQGYIHKHHNLMLGENVDLDFDRTYVFQGTVLEDATAGTHVSSLTVTPGAGNELEIHAWRIQVGNTATAQTATATVDDGTNTLYSDFNISGGSDTVANQRYQGPMVTSGTVASVKDASVPSWTLKLSGTMRLVLSVTTTAVSVTQTFAVVVRVKGRTNPTFTLADTVGTPTLTTNTSAEF